jgi:radical SAM superfamily enzyme YgiQ (UPF0313 family)
MRWSPARGARGFARPILHEQRPDHGLPARRRDRQTLRGYFIKPSRYDDDGSVLRFRWGVIPNNTLIALAGLNEAYAQARPEVDVQTVLWDEMVDGLISPQVVRSIHARGEADGVEVIVGLAGVQTNQYPRARDVGLQFKQLGLPVVMGGFHVSSHEPTREFLRSVGIVSVIGEADDTWAALLDDHRRGALQESYRVTDGVRVKTGAADITVPLIQHAPLPAIDDRYATRFFNPTFSTIDTSRGCPFTCSYCSVKNVMGRTMRSRDPIRVIAWMRDAYDQHGIRNLLVVDDDFFRNPEWDSILRGMVQLRTTRPDLAFVIQTDIEAAADAGLEAREPGTRRQQHGRRFVELAAAAGCFEVFMGFESFNPAALEYTQKFHNEEPQDRRKSAREPDAAVARLKARYRRVVDVWHGAGVGVHCGYMIGFPFDGEGCGKEAALNLTEIGVDIATFFIHTPFPGTDDHERAVARGLVVNHDFNDFDSTHMVLQHPQLNPAEIEREYLDAYRHFYTWRRLAWSLATFHRVPGLTTTSRAGMMSQQVYFTYATRRGWHPMMGGIWRVRDPQVRRRAVSDREAAELYLGARPASVTPAAAA